MSRVYLETSFFSACVSTRTSPKSLGWKASSLEWWETQRHRHQLFISSEVVRELSDEEYVNREPALEMLHGLALLELTTEVAEFADVLVMEKVMPGPSVLGDALHVAVATVHEMQHILTWNVLHLANPRKRTHFAIICMRLGLVAPVMVTPDMLMEADDE